MSIIPEVHPHALQALGDVVLDGTVAIRAAIMEPGKRYKIDVSDPSRRVIYVNGRDYSPGVLAAGLVDACARLRRHDREQRRSAMRVVEGDDVGGTDVVPARPSLRVLAGGAR